MVLYFCMLRVACVKLTLAHLFSAHFLAQLEVSWGTANPNLSCLFYNAVARGAGLFLVHRSGSSFFNVISAG